MGPSPSRSRGVPQTQVAEIQRSRLLAAAARAFDELGYADTSVAHIVGRARVSRRTFYEMFSGREECLLAVLDQAVALIRAELAQAGLEDLRWRERIRTGLSTTLAFFEREPVLARVLVVHVLSGGAGLLERRQQIVAELVHELDRGPLEGARRAGRAGLTAEGLVGATFSIVHTRLLREASPPLVELHGELMEMIVLPYLGAAAARREAARPAPRPTREESPHARSAVAASDPLESVPMRVTYRTAKVLEGLLERPGASNRQLGERAGIADPGQISKLVWRLQRLGLLTNDGAGHPKGEPNAWRLTAEGEEVALSIQRHAPSQTRRVA